MNSIQMSIALINKNKSITQGSTSSSTAVSLPAAIPTAIRHSSSHSGSLCPTTPSGPEISSSSDLHTSWATKQISIKRRSAVSADPTAIRWASPGYPVLEKWTRSVRPCTRPGTAPISASSSQRWWWTSRSTRQGLRIALELRGSVTWHQLRLLLSPHFSVF